MTATNTTPAVLTLTVPPDAEPGIDSLAFQYRGQELEIIVPATAKPGDVLEVRLGIADGGDAHDDDDHDDDNDHDEDDHDEEAETRQKSSVEPVDASRETHAERTSEKDEECSSKADGNVAVLPLHRNDQREITSLRLAQAPPPNNDDDGDGTNAVVWPTGIVLAQALNSPAGTHFLQSRILACSPPLRCLELGSGSGACGLALAHALSRLSSRDDEVGGARVVLTDRGRGAVESMRENIRRNLRAFRSETSSTRRVSVEATSLSWGETLSGEEKFDVVLGSDLLYDARGEATYGPLVRTMRRHLRREGRILLGVRWRKPLLEREFFEIALRSGLEFVLWDRVPEKDAEWRRRCPCRLGWREYGDPECDASNAFFHDTMVSIGGYEKSLAEVRESDLEGMSEEEYTVFEECQIQIYVGKFANDSETRCGDEVTPKKRGIRDIST
ncbi:hypothetical protein ACHAW6_004076 [Cyclotella cf. meneghiniana]